MDSLRNVALLVAVIAFSLSGKPAYAQQEVAPDHFDGSDAQVQKAAPVHHHQKQAHATMARKSSAKHHHAHQAA